MLTFGRVTDVKGPGLYWKIPLIQSVISESVTTIHTKEYGLPHHAHGFRRARQPPTPTRWTKA